MCTKEMQIVINIVIKILDVIKFLVPVFLIFYSTIDIFKIVVTKKEDEVKKLRKDIFMKILYAIIIYLIPVLVPIIFNFACKILPLEYDDSWHKCWNYVKSNQNNY